MAPYQHQGAAAVSYPTSSLPLPKALRHNRSFACLANLLGLASTSDAESSLSDGRESAGKSKNGGPSGSEQNGHGEEDGEEDEDETGDVDEDSLLWDAQTALIAHQPALAIQHYTIAALPPYRSSPACLALGNLLTRGSGLAPAPQSPSEQTSRFTAAEKGKGRAYSFGPMSPTMQTGPKSPEARRGSAPPPTSPSQSAVSRFMGFVWPTSPPERPAPASPPERTYTDLVASGWTIPKEGKRAVRDVEGMGVAGGWFVLGLGWIVDGQMALGVIAEGEEVIASQERLAVPDEADSDALVMGSKKGKARLSPIIPPVELVVRIAGVATPGETEGNAESSSEGTTLKTPPHEQEDGETREENEKTIKLIYDLLQPLLRLYRNGHIQSSDPVYLPPINYSQLPTCLRPQGDLQKRRNVWSLGGRVLKQLLGLKIMRAGMNDRRGLVRRRKGVEVMARYILAMTGPSAESEAHYRQIISLGHSGLEYPDEIVRHAAKHLDIINSPPVDTPPLTPYTSRRPEYPFPHMAPSPDFLKAPKRSFTSPSRIKPSQTRVSRHVQQASISSIRTTCSTRIMGTSIKSFPSIPSLAEASSKVEVNAVANSDGAVRAVDTLRRVHAQSVMDLAALAKKEGDEAWWPALASWSYTKSRDKFSPPSSPPIASPDPEAADEANAMATPIIVSHPGASPTKAAAARPPIPTIRTVASTPTFGSLRQSPHIPNSSGHLTPRPFDNLHADINTTIDPALAAAELASTLTRRVKCGVCRTEGINFPECRRCGIVFCSRECRVGADKAGDGKRHVCGAWEGRRGLCVPERVDGRQARTAEAPRQVMAC